MIRIAHLAKSFRRQRVLDDLTLTIDAGERIALIGANGAGKTTLIRCLLGEYTYEGEILIEGRSPRLERRAVLSAIGFVPQLPPPLRMPVGEIVRFACAVSGTARRDVADVLARLGLALEDVAAMPFVRLSGGQKQKILAAIALGRRTGMLILDEPTANLDPAARKVLFDLLAARADQPMLISSHRLEEVAGLVTRVVELDRGRVVLDERLAPSDGLAGRLACTITLARPQPAFAAAMGDWGLTGSGDGIRWHGEVAAADRLRFLATLSRYGGLVSSLELGADRAIASAQPASANERESRHALQSAR